MCCYKLSRQQAFIKSIRKAHIGKAALAIKSYKQLTEDYFYEALTDNKVNLSLFTESVITSP